MWLWCQGSRAAALLSLHTGPVGPCLLPSWLCGVSCVSEESYPVEMEICNQMLKGCGFSLVEGQCVSLVYQQIPHCGGWEICVWLWEMHVHSRLLLLRRLLERYLERATKTGGQGTPPDWQLELRSGWYCPAPAFRHCEELTSQGELWHCFPLSIHLDGYCDWLFKMFPVVVSW